MRPHRRLSVVSAVRSGIRGSLAGLVWAQAALTVLAPPMQSLTTDLPADLPASPPGGLSRGWPLDPRPGVVHGFVEPSHRYGAGHRGADLTGALGQPVLAAAPGTVRFAGVVAGVPVVTVDHPGGFRTTYQPVAATVRAGDVVTRTAPLGFLTPVHSHCAPMLCLHWGLLEVGPERYLDPLSWVERRRVRLLPLHR